MDPNIKQDPNGICSLNSFLNEIYKAIPNIEPKRRIIEREKPDYAIVTVDRVETLAIASICALMNIPILHFQGGEISGTIDESIRHAVSKLSHFHFVSTPNSKKKIFKIFSIIS